MRAGASFACCLPRAIPRSRAPPGESRGPAAPAARRPGRPCGGLEPASRKFAHEASKTPRLTPVCSTAAIQGRQRRARSPTATSADGPFAANPQRRQESKDQQLPPRLREEGQAGEQRVGEDRQHQRPAAAQPVADPPKKPPPRPSRPGTPPGSRSCNSRRSLPRVGRRPATRPRTGPRPARKGACPGRRTASPARRRCPISTGGATGSCRFWIALQDAVLGPSRDMRSPCGIDGLIGIVPKRRSGT